MEAKLYVALEAVKRRINITVNLFINKEDGFEKNVEDKDKKLKVIREVMNKEGRR